MKKKKVYCKGSNSNFKGVKYNKDCLPLYCFPISKKNTVADNI